MEPTTFGKSESARILAEILDNHPKVRKNVSSRLHEFNSVSKALIESNLDASLKKSFLKNTLERFKHKLNKFEGEVQTFSQNVLKQNYRMYLDKI